MQCFHDLCLVRDQVVTTGGFLKPMLCMDYIGMMTSPNGNIFRVTGHLCWEFTGPRWISRSKGQWRSALMFSLICARINGWVNNREAGDLRCHRGHYDVTVMVWFNLLKLCCYSSISGDICKEFLFLLCMVIWTARCGFEQWVYPCYPGFLNGHWESMIVPIPMKHLGADG